MHTEYQTRTHERQKSSSEVVDLTADEFDSPAHLMGPQTQLEVWKSVDKVDAEIEHVKRMKDFETPSFSLRLTIDFEMGTKLDATEFDMGHETQHEVVATVDQVVATFSSGKSVKSLGISRFGNSENARQESLD
ncbi:hypothetical protein Tco_0334154, partial [Tanacetum coccineum]